MHVFLARRGPRGRVSWVYVPLRVRDGTRRRKSRGLLSLRSLAQGPQLRGETRDGYTLPGLRHVSEGIREGVRRKVKAE